MNHGTKDLQHSNLDAERTKLGENLKEMGKMSHKGANQDVRKEKSKLGDMNSLQ